MAPALIALSLTTVAHAQGTMDFSDAQTLMGTFKTALMKALLDHVSLHERLIVIEQPAELKIAHPNAVRWRLSMPSPARLPSLRASSSPPRCVTVPTASSWAKSVMSVVMTSCKR